MFLGGVITEYLSWPWVFYINIPIALVALLATGPLMPAAPARRGSVDVLGALTVTLGLGAAVYAIVRAPEVGWGSAQTWLVLAAAVALLGAFVAIQARRREPLMRLSVFRTPDLAAANLTQTLLGGAWFPMWFFLNLYPQQVLGYSAFPSGAAAADDRPHHDRHDRPGAQGHRTVRPQGHDRHRAGLLAAGMVWLAFIRPDGSFAADVLPAGLVAALGMSLAFISSLGTAISSARPEEGGLASGIVNTSYQVGSALGLAAMTAVAAANGSGRLGDLPALTDGFSAAFIGAAGIALAGALLAAVTLRTRGTGHAEPAEIRS
ncbi:hypothetical protein [Nonomuraea aridisoli]|uniref:hypothetical protein n=1 Tax=Nonomuraea aridisoli TaxID=2070368 RepID=UPI001C64DE27|nr:hypothetical protein [Nonomuraea aridisoli]